MRFGEVLPYLMDGERVKHGGMRLPLIRKGDRISVNGDVTHDYILTPDDFSRLDWSVEKVKYLNFKEAVLALAENKEVKRHGWACRLSSPYDGMILETSGDHKAVWIPLIKDLLAEDWMVVT